MNRSFLVILPVAFMTLLLTACASKPWQKPQTIAPTPTSDKGGVDGHPILSMPIRVPGQSVVFVPLAMQNSKGFFERSDPYAGGVASYARATYDALPQPLLDTNQQAEGETSRVLEQPWNSGYDVRWHNVIARDAEGHEWLLLNRRGFIGRWEMFGSSQRVARPTVECRGLLLIAVVEDSNGDHQLTGEDARVAIVADPDGRHSRQISPSDAQAWSTYYDPRSDSLYLQVVQDTNHDGHFGFDDDSMPYEWKRGSDQPARPVISSDILGRALELLK